MNLSQNLPLNYPAIIIKFLQQRIDDGEFKALSTDDTLDEFDKVEFDGLIYRLDVYQEEELVCIKEELNNQVYNITKHDYTERYKDMPELLALLNYIESQVRFSVSDWFDYFTDYAPLYNGVAIDVFKLVNGSYMVRPKIAGNTQGFQVTGDLVHKASNISILTGIQSGRAAMLFDCIISDEDKAPFIVSQMEETLLYLFNTEFNLSNFMSSRHGDTLAVGNINFSAIPESIDLCGIEVVVNQDDMSLAFEWDNKRFDISKAGHLNTTKVEELKPASKGGLWYSNQIWSRINSGEEIALAHAVVKLTNLLYGESDVESLPI